MFYVLVCSCPHEEGGGCWDVTFPLVVMLAGFRIWMIWIATGFNLITHACFWLDQIGSNPYSTQFSQQVFIIKRSICKNIHGFGQLQKHPQGFQLFLSLWFILFYFIIFTFLIFFCFVFETHTFTRNIEISSNTKVHNKHHTKLFFKSCWNFHVHQINP